MRVESAHSSEDEESLLDFTAEPTHSTAPPKEVCDPDFVLTGVSPIDVEDTKYTVRRRSSVSENRKPIVYLDPVTLDISLRHCAPEGWERCVAPEGNVYFYHKEMRTFTHADMDDLDQALWIEKAAAELQRRRSRFPNLPHDTDIVLDYQSDGYYLTSWSSKYIFFLEQVGVDVLTKGYRDALSNTHYLMHSLFWRHVQMFPNQYVLTEDALEELKAAVTYGYGDTISSETSTFPYDASLLLHIARVIENVKAGEPDPYHISTVARYMDNLNNERFLHYHGEVCARLNRMDGVEEQPDAEHRSPFFNVASVLLFYLPSLYFKELEKVYVDRTVHYWGWRRFISELKSDWENSITPATVLLSANVGFLAIQSIDNTESYARSVAQIASYASALFSLIDYVVVQILMRRHRCHLYDTAERGMKFLSAREDLVGLEMVALSVSLPGGLFIWSMLTFLLALEFIFYHHSTLATMVTLSAVAAILGAMVFSLFLMNYLGDKEDEPSDGSLLQRLLKSLRSQLLYMFRSRRSGGDVDDEIQKRSWRTSFMFRKRHPNNSSV